MSTAWMNHRVHEVGVRRVEWLGGAWRVLRRISMKMGMLAAVAI